MKQVTGNVVTGQMVSRERGVWTPVKPAKREKKIGKRLLRNTMVFAVVSLCLGTGVLYAANHPNQAVMQHVTAGFEYDDTLGRLQFVSNILPESVMVFLQSSDGMQRVSLPTNASVCHAWSQEEPWLEYACEGNVYACSDGEVMTVVKNRQNEYTVRVLHRGGYESIYSGLNAVSLTAQDTVSSGQQIGTAGGFAAFELRKDGLSIQPAFSEM